MKVIELSRGFAAIVDDEDFAELAQYNWCCNAGGYAYRRKKISEPKKGSGVYMHRVIIGDSPEGMVVDHVNRNKLDNRRENLRFVTKAQNNYNQGTPCTNTSGLKGVQFRAHAKKFAPTISMNKKTTFLGYYKTPEDAALAYNAAALRLRGEYAVLN